MRWWHLWEELEDRLVVISRIPAKVKKLSIKRQHISDDYYRAHSFPPCRPLDPILPTDPMSPETITMIIISRECQLDEKIAFLNWYYSTFCYMLQDEQGFTIEQTLILINSHRLPINVYQGIEDILKSIDEAIDRYFNVRSIDDEKHQIEELTDDVTALFAELEEVEAYEDD